jgi:UDP-N-acetylglucosamine 2-epimerase (non-hydrolysing)
LSKEGVPEEKIIFVRNIMIDTLEANRERAEMLSINEIINNNLLSNQPAQKILNAFFPPNGGTEGGGSFAVMTLHRPSNVDLESVFRPILDFLINEVIPEMPLIWPIHPRAKKQIESFGLWEEVISHPNLILLNPIDYLEMLRLNMSASVMLTDSGGLQEECTILGTPCLTLRWNTERPITLTKHKGVSILVGNNIQNIRKGYAEALAMGRSPHRPELWDGHTAERCLQAIIDASVESER